MNRLRYGVLAATFALATVTIALGGAVLASPGLVALALIPAFAAGWCDGRSYWS